MSKLPNFLIAGVPKAATTSLYAYIREHPQVYTSTQKELHYFSRNYLFQNTEGPGDKEALSNICSSIEDYKNHFAGVNGETAIGEASPSYFHFYECTGEIKQVLGPATKIIIMLRHPVQRAYSNYLHLHGDGRETLPFHEALLAEDQRIKDGWGDFWRYRNHSLYASRLRHFMNEFGESNVKVVLYEDFVSNIRDSLHDVFEFLNVDTDFTPSNTHVVYNRSDTHAKKPAASQPSNNKTWKSVVKKMLPASTIKHLRNLRSAKPAREANTAPPKPHAIDDKAIDFLRPYFTTDIEALESNFGFNLTSWKTM